MLNRDPKIQKQREQLPVFQHEQEVMEIINDNVVTILCGKLILMRMIPIFVEGKLDLERQHRFRNFFMKEGMQKKG